ncbi:protein-disulfide reductase DsbD family protein [Gilvimarinus polysaccharolyticus]|uniref:protein-disulfide reductase DsbD family protein n=1 Tax=Gilvimarinus polysaccharolyticus TaxID=863921 RepID=UPI0006736E87|nr:protein-disulfide reductase DsbD [Gilvimarinus polysaccharolyticus]
MSIYNVMITTLKRRQLLTTIRQLLLLLMLSLSALTYGSNAIELVPPKSANPAAGMSLAGPQASAEPEFLPVTEAYMLSAWVRDGALILHWDIEPGYYLYQERFELTTDDGAVLTPEFSPSVEQYDEYFDKNMALHFSSATLTLALSADLPPFNLKVQSQGCAAAGLCYPPYDDYLRINPSASSADRIDVDSFKSNATSPANALASNGGAHSAMGLWAILALALAGGVILNLMPCVFPVLSIKVLSLTNTGEQHAHHHGWAYTLGILVSFIGFATLLLIARASGEAAGWGFQLQSPLVIAALIYLFVLMGLVLSGLVDLGSSLMGAGQRLTQSRGLTGSFFTGVLAAVVASPCTAPFMGVALGYALTQPAATALLVFIALGFGMALPLLLLCYIPALIRHLPAPGPWMDTLKQLLAFPIYLTALWLLWVLGHQAGSDAIVTLLLGALLFGFALWLRQHKPAGTVARTAINIVATIAVVLALALPFSVVKSNANRNTNTDHWQAYSAATLTQLRADGRGVFINLTADWCVTCLTNEAVVLSTNEIEQAFKTYNIATLKGDWTNGDPAITELLQQYQRSGVPLYLWFAPNNTDRAVILPQLLRKKHLLDEFKRAYPDKT